MGCKRFCKQMNIRLAQAYCTNYRMVYSVYTCTIQLGDCFRRFQTTNRIAPFFTVHKADVAAAVTPPPAHPPLSTWPLQDLDAAPPPCACKRSPPSSFPRTGCAAPRVPFVARPPHRPLLNKYTQMETSACRAGALYQRCQRISCRLAGGARPCATPYNSHGHLY